MKKFENLSPVHLYLLSLITSLIFYYPFDKLNIFIFKPVMFGGNLYLEFPSLVENVLNGTLFAFYFFLPFFIFLLAQKKQCLTWAIGVAVPLSVAFTGGMKHIIWALIFSALGWGLAKGILLIKDKK